MKVRNLPGPSGEIMTCCVKTLSIVACFVFLFVTVAGSADPSPDTTVYRFRLTGIDPAADIPHVDRLGMDIAGFNRKGRTVDLVGTNADMALLAEQGFEIVVLEDLTRTEETVAALSDYLNPAEVNARIDQYIADYPDLIIKTQYATTENGRPVYAMKVSDNAGAEENEPAILFVGQHHAREVMTPEITMDIIDQLLTGYGSDPQITAWVDSLEIWVIVSHNPDGADYVFTNSSGWRKNRRDNGDGNFGVDPNRNYPFQWGACNGSDGFTSSDTYRGPTPASEPETWQGIMELAREQRPAINLSYHTYSELVIMPYGCDGSYTPETPTFRDLSSSLATKLVSDTGAYWYEPGTGWEILYAVDGEMTDWFYGELGSFGMTVEANSSSQGFQPNYATWRDDTVARNRPGWRYLLDRFGGPIIQGHVTDACTGAPLEATTSLDEVVYTNGETPRTSEPSHGRIDWPVVPGTWNLRVALDGYVEQVRTLEVDLEPVLQEYRLVPTGSFGLTLSGFAIGDAAGDGDGEADPGEEFDLAVSLHNTGGNLTGVTATLSTTDPNVIIVDGASAYGTMATGAQADGDGFTVRLSGIAPDEAMALMSVTFGADQILCTSGESFALRITTGSRSCPSIGEPLDNDPAWQIQNSDPSGWAFGPPTGNGGSTGPAAAATGLNVYGTDLAGSYGDSAQYTLTTGPFDLRGVRHAELQYRRWLYNEAGFDIARIEISVDGGQNWSQIWSGFEYGEGWDLHRLDIEQLADFEEDVRFRFSLESDASTSRPGMYIDDISICAEDVPHAAGKLKYLSHTLDDSDPDGGNGNGIVDAGETVGLEITLQSNRDSVAEGVEAFLTTTTPGVTARTGYAGYDDIPAAGAGISLAPGFSFTVDENACATHIQFQVEARWNGGGAASSFAVPVGELTQVELMQDDLETDQGWTVGGTATAGQWVREDPYFVDDGFGTAVQPENDTTADPGVLAWITANPRPKGNFNPGDGDVDGGAVTLDSPAFDGTDAESLIVSFNRWFVRRNPGQFDASRFRVLASGDDGQSWWEVSMLDADSPFWAPVSLDLVEALPPTGAMRLRLEVLDDNGGFGGDTLVEGLVDDFLVTRKRLECAPFNPPARQAPNGIGDTLQVGKSGSGLRLDWVSPAVDAGHDGADAYRVYRSESAAAGYGQVAGPTAEFHVFMDDLVSGPFGYYLITAENNGGTSGDEPAP